MPDGITHFEIGIAGGLAGALTVALSPDPSALRAFVIGTALGLFITPDLDQEGTTLTERLLRRIPLVGFLFQVSWYPYALMFRHRGLSHHIIIGTPGRIIWTAGLLLFWATLVIGAQWLATGQPVNWVDQVVRPLWQQAHVTLFLAWWLQDLFHIAADVLVSEIKAAF